MANERSDMDSRGKKGLPGLNEQFRPRSPLLKGE